jgi:hypothetical protein
MSMMRQNPGKTHLPEDYLAKTPAILNNGSFLHCLTATIFLRKLIKQGKADQIVEQQGLVSAIFKAKGGLQVAEVLFRELYENVGAENRLKIIETIYSASAMELPSYRKHPSRLRAVQPGNF